MRGGSDCVDAECNFELLLLLRDCLLDERDPNFESIFGSKPPPAPASAASSGDILRVKSAGVGPSTWNKVFDD